MLITSGVKGLRDPYGFLLPNICKSIVQGRNIRTKTCLSKPDFFLELPILNCSMMELITKHRKLLIIVN